MKIDRYRRKFITIPLIAPVVYGFSQLSDCTPPLTDEERIKADFMEGRTVVVDGWILSQHEASILSKEKK